ncbi:MAG: SurA N-terminal domain-containing protein, partial [Candidatus Stygibacter frigidus]|nr:SurA N-terminal domain-containing protein [Candidatus Stygibacter frigidus]
MLKLKILGLILLVSGILFCVPVAWVEDLPIEGEEFQEKMAELPDSLDLVSRRQQAMDNMIEEKLLLLFGREQKLEVSEEETEALFISAFSDHEMFMTDGKFDNDKFNELKGSPRLQEILAEMHEDILIQKTKALVMRSLEKSDDELLERFFLGNVKIDVSYAQFDLSDVSISPQLTASGAQKYFLDNRNRYMKEPVVKLGLTKIPYADFRSTAEDIVAEQVQEVTVYDLLKEYAEGDSVDMEKLRIRADELNQENSKKAIIKEEHRLAKEAAQRVKSNLERDLPIRYPKITTGFVKPAGATGRIPKDIIRQGLEMQWGEVNEPLEMSDGFLITWLIEKKRSAEVELEDVKQRVWQDYIRDLDFQGNAEEYRRYFYAHLDDYKVPALVVNRVDLTEQAYGRKWPLSKDKDRIISELEKYLFNEDYLAWVAEDNGLTCETRTIYMEKYGFKDEIDQRIAEMVDAGTVYGVVSGDGIESFFVVSSIYPRYIPEFDDLMELGYFKTV